MTAPNRPIYDGLVVGLIAYAAVAVLYGVFDLLAARGALYTVNQLGLALVRGVRDTGQVGMPIPLDYAAIALYNALHLFASLAIGFVVTGLVAHSLERPARAPTILVVLIAGFVGTVALIGVVTIPMRPVLPWWSIILANTLAVMVAARYVIRRFPSAFSRLTVPTDR